MLVDRHTIDLREAILDQRCAASIGDVAVCASAPGELADGVRGVLEL
jgi:hypothetical protein